MDQKIKNYQQIIETCLYEEAADRNIPGVDFQVITDNQNYHYQLVETGWYEKRFLHSVLFHFHIKPDVKVSACQ